MTEQSNDLIQAIIDDAVALRRKYITEMDKASEDWNTFSKPHRNSIGLVSDEIRNSDEYKQLARAYYMTKERLASFNKMHKDKIYIKAFKAETLRHYGRTK